MIFLGNAQGIGRTPKFRGVGGVIMLFVTDYRTCIQISYIS